MRIEVANCQRLMPINRFAVERLASFFIAKIARADPTWLSAGISVMLTDDATIREINSAFLMHDEPTDVISFRYGAMPDQSGVPCLGEVVVNVQRALSIGPSHGGALRELALYIAHGIDHLSGADDKTVAQRRRMRRRESAWLKQAESLVLGTGGKPRR